MNLELSFCDLYIIWEALNKLEHDLKLDINDCSYDDDYFAYFNHKFVTCCMLREKIEKSLM